MRPLARVGDSCIGTCYCHPIPLQVSGVLIKGAAITSSSVRQNCRIGDIALFNCGHTGTVASGSPNLLIEGIGAAHIGDSIVGCVVGLIVKGDQNVLGF